jgi:hypothetical protein
MDAAATALNGQTVRVDKVQDSVCYTPVVDTAQITQIYLQRPSNLATWKLGQWFAAAHKDKLSFEDKRQLSLCASGQETKLLIVRKGYNQFPLHVLTDFNAQKLREGNKE